MLIGYYTGWSINRFLKILSNGYIAGIIGAALSHIIADLIASLIDPHIRSMVVGIVLVELFLFVCIHFLKNMLLKVKTTLWLVIMKT